jgi:hypothetical protein
MRNWRVNTPSGTGAERRLAEGRHHKNAMEGRLPVIPRSALDGQVKLADPAALVVAVSVTG